MADTINLQSESYIGPFWYDPNNREIYGAVLTLASDVPFYNSSTLNKRIRTGRALHQQIWDKQSKRSHKDPRFTGDYRLKPRGHIFEIENEGFVIFVGNWINKYPQAIDEIVNEFQLPLDNTRVQIDQHWDLGHGWSKEI